MAASSKVVDLRKLLAERYPQIQIAPRACIATGLLELDTTIGGGLPKGGITELSSANISGGSALLIYRLLQSVQEKRTFLALIDGRDSFDPQPLGDLILRNL